MFQAPPSSPSRKTRVAYWACTLFVALTALGAGIMDILHVQPLFGVLLHLGYPSYFAAVLGVWKVLGAIVLVAPRYPLVKEWAYAGNGHRLLVRRRLSLGIRGCRFGRRRPDRVHHCPRGVVVLAPSLAATGVRGRRRARARRGPRAATNSTTDHASYPGGAPARRKVWSSFVCP
jgi:hypothetical protein